MGSAHDTDRRRRSRGRTPLRIVFAVLGAVAGVLVIGACGGDDDAAGEAADATVAAADTLDAPELAVDGSTDLSVEETAETVPAGDREARGVPAGALDTGFGLDALGRDLAVEVRVTMTSDDLRATVDGIRRAAVTAGGGVVSADVDYGPGTDEPDAVPDGRAVLVVKVPPAALDTVLGGLDALGTVTQVGQDAEDVTDRLVDLDVRIRTQTELVERVRGLLASTTDLEQVIRLEGELTERQTELERLLATQQQLEDRVALSTLTITVEPSPVAPAAVEVPEDDGGLREAFATGWDAFVTVGFGAGFVLAVLAPFLVVTAIVAGVLWIAIRSRRARRAPPGADDTVDDVTQQEPESASPRG